MRSSTVKGLKVDQKFRFCDPVSGTPVGPVHRVTLVQRASAAGYWIITTDLQRWSGHSSTPIEKQA